MGSFFFLRYSTNLEPMTCTTSLPVWRAMSSAALPGGQGGGLYEHPALDELPLLQSVVRLLDDLGAHAGLAHHENGVLVYRQGAEIGPLLAG